MASSFGFESCASFAIEREDPLSEASLGELHWGCALHLFAPLLTITRIG